MKGIRNDLYSVTLIFDTINFTNETIFNLIVIKFITQNNLNKNLSYYLYFISLKRYNLLKINN